MMGEEAGRRTSQVSPEERDLIAFLARTTATDAAGWHLAFKARFGMEAVFRALASACGAGSVLTQLYTCCTAVDPIIAAGLTPVFGDVTATGFSLDPDALPVPQDAPVHAIMMQHTYGIIDAEGAQRLRKRADELGALLVEDCAHAVGRMAPDAHGAPLADISIHSFGVEKLVPSRFGGAIWLNHARLDKGLAKALATALDALPALDARRARAARTYRTQNRILAHLPRAISRPLRAALVSRGLFESAVTQDEQRGKVAGPGARPDAWVARHALAACADYADNLALRRAMVAAYRHELTGVARPLGVTPAHDVEVPAPVLDGAFDQPLLLFPVFVRDADRADRAVRALRAAGYYARPWYRPLLFPGSLDDAAYGIDTVHPGLPVTERCSQGAVMLPCDLSVEAVPAIVACLLKALGVDEGTSRRG